jgi:hypothetical protein
MASFSAKLVGTWLPPCSRLAGRNSVPYCVLERSYSAGSVKTVLAAGNVTSTMPCATPAA